MYLKGQCGASKGFRKGYDMARFVVYKDLQTFKEWTG